MWYDELKQETPTVKSTANLRSISEVTADFRDSMDDGLSREPRLLCDARYDFWGRFFQLHATVDSDADGYGLDWTATASTLDTAAL